MRRPQRSLPCAQLATLLAAAAACASPSLRPGDFAIVERRTVEDVYILTGEVRAVISAPISAPHLPQPQIRWLAEDGATVKEGEPVVEFDSASVLAELEERRTAVVQAEIQMESKSREVEAETDKRRAAVEKAEVEARKARVDAEVPEELRSSLEWRKLQAALREAEAAFEKACLEVESFDVAARSELVSLRSELQKARRQLATAEGNLRCASVSAPRSGIFLVGRHWRRDEDRRFQVGDSVWPGFPIASIPDPTRMEVDARLSAVDHGRVSVGMPARVVLDIFPDRSFEAEVAAVGSVSDAAPERPGFPVRVSLRQRDPALMRPGLSVRVDVLRGRFQGALVVPRSAVRFVEGRAVVGASGGEAGVEIETCTPLECVVRSGLHEGERVRVL